VERIHGYVLVSLRLNFKLSSPFPKNQGVNKKKLKKITVNMKIKVLKITTIHIKGLHSPISSSYLRALLLANGIVELRLILQIDALWLKAPKSQNLGITLTL
jgi:hypothetical protein